MNQKDYEILVTSMIDAMAKRIFELVSQGYTKGQIIEYLKKVGELSREEGVKVNIKMYKKLKIKMYKKFTQFCIGSEDSESIFNLFFKRYELPLIFIMCE